MTSNLVAYWRFGEDRRHNYENELLNQQQLAETIRHNQAMESLQQRQISLGFANLAEQTRHNQVQEGTAWVLGRQQQEEIHRHNFAMETLQGAAQHESKRHNISVESMTQDMNEHKKWYERGSLSLAQSKFGLDVMSTGVDVITDVSREAHRWVELVPKYASNIIDSIIPF